LAATSLTAFLRAENGPPRALPPAPVFAIFMGDEFGALCVRAPCVRLCPQPADCWPFLATSVRHCVATWCTVLQRGVLCCNVVHCDATAQSVRNQCRSAIGCSFVCRRTAARRLRSCEHCHRLSLLHTDSQNVRYAKLPCSFNPRLTCRLRPALTLSVPLFTISVPLFTSSVRLYMISVPFSSTK
jgi:hypothetical protein